MNLCRCGYRCVGEVVFVGVGGCVDVCVGVCVGVHVYWGSMCSMYIAYRCVFEHSVYV